MLVQQKVTTNRLFTCAYCVPFLFILFIFLRFSVFELSSYLYGRRLPINGHNNVQFEPVRDAFRSNFLEGLERDGASFAVYHKGQAVVNMWSGTSDTKSQKPWTKDTRTLMFSTTKALSALSVAILVQQGHLKWDDKISKFWPEYAQNGKQETTVQHVLSHQAGIPYIKESIYYDDALNITKALDKIARSTPIWKPGTKTGYHALTFGWILDGLIYHADPKHRHLGQFFKEEIADKYDVDVSIGAESPEDFERSAVMSSPTNFDYFRDIFTDLRMLFMISAYYFQPSNSIISLSAKNPHWIHHENIAFNTYSIQRLKLGAVNGLSNADNLARLFSLFINGSMVSQTILDQMKRPVVDNWHLEQTVLYPIMKGYGFFYEAHPTQPGKYVFGHPGFGCQSLHVDLAEQLVVVYLSNSLKSATSILCHPYQRLLNAVYSSL